MKKDLMAVELFTVKEVAEKLRVRPRTVYRWLKTGRMRAIPTPGGQYRIPGEELRQEWASRLISEPEASIDPDPTTCRPENGYHATPHRGCALR